MRAWMVMPVLWACEAQYVHKSTHVEGCGGSGKVPILTENYVLLFNTVADGIDLNTGEKIRFSARSADGTLSDWLADAAQGSVRAEWQPVGIPQVWMWNLNKRERRTLKLPRDSYFHEVVVKGPNADDPSGSLTSAFDSADIRVVAVGDTSTFEVLESTFPPIVDGKVYVHDFRELFEHDIVSGQFARSPMRFHPAFPPQFGLGQWLFVPIPKGTSLPRLVKFIDRTAEDSTFFSEAFLNEPFLFGDVKQGTGIPYPHQIEGDTVVCVDFGLSGIVWQTASLTYIDPPLDEVDDGDYLCAGSNAAGERIYYQKLGQEWRALEIPYLPHRRLQAAGNRVVYADDRFGRDHRAIFVYDLETDLETPLTPRKGAADCPTIFGDRIAFLDYTDPIVEVSRTENYDGWGNTLESTTIRGQVVLYDLSTGERRCLTCGKEY